MRIFLYLIGIAFVITPLLALAQTAMQHEPVTPIPLTIELDQDKVRLGKELFHDTRLSQNNTMSCASCHAIEQKGIIKGMAHSMPGVSGIAEPINIPTVFNSSFNFIQFWDGRADNLESQIDGPLHNKNELGMTWKEVITRINNDSIYRDRFIDLYSTPPTETAIKDAIATYERSLITPNAPFDQFLRGDKDAISAQAKNGYRYFKKYGCASCHQGMNLGGNMFQTFGVMQDYFKDRGNITRQDLGRFNVTGDEEDKYVFRVPPLRNIADTAPYFHDGSTATLEGAIIVMGQYQLGRDLDAQEVGALAAFLRSLSGEYHEEVSDEE